MNFSPCNLWFGRFLLDWLADITNTCHTIGKCDIKKKIKLSQHDGKDIDAGAAFLTNKNATHYVVVIGVVKGE
jgi:hypothetical protein